MYVQSCCFCHQTYCFFDVLVTIDVVVPNKNQMNDPWIEVTELSGFRPAHIVRDGSSLRMKSCPV